MHRVAMHRLAHHGNHTAAPKGWRDVPNVTGDYDFDATIQHGRNSDMPLRLDMYLGGRNNGPGYGPLTGYNGYHNYHGDT